LEKFDLVSSMVIRPLDVQLVIVRTCALNAPSSACLLSYRRKKKNPMVLKMKKHTAQ